MRAFTTFFPLRSRLAACVGVTYLLLFLAGPLAHAHASHDETSRSHHVHGFSSSAAQDSGVPVVPPASVPDHGHTVAGADGSPHVALVADLSAMLPESVRAQPFYSVASIQFVSLPPAPGAIRSDRITSFPASPTSSGQLALHQGTDPSPPGA